MKKYGFILWISMVSLLLAQESPKKVYIFGDSLSTPQTWPAQFQKLTGIPTFSQAIGGSQSPSQLKRAQGVELMNPETVKNLKEGSQALRWHRHQADRTDDIGRKRHWPYYGAQVATPTKIEVFVDGKKVGEATRILRDFHTDYERSKTQIFCKQHGLQEGSRVTFYSRDPLSPNSDLDLTSADTPYRWFYTSPDLPKGLVERKVYHVLSATEDAFEVKQLTSDTEPLDVGSDLSGSAYFEAGWTFDLTITNSQSSVTWKSRTVYDNWIFVIASSANDWGKTDASKVTIPNTLEMAARNTSRKNRVMVLCPCFGSYSHWSPDSVQYANYYEVYMPAMKKHFGGRLIDIMAILDDERSEEEIVFLKNPEVPELKWISGDPSDASTWKVTDDKHEGGSHQWVGPGYLPLQYRNSLSDGIHWNGKAGALIAEKVRDKIQAKGW